MRAGKASMTGGHTDPGDPIVLSIDEASAVLRFDAFDSEVFDRPIGRIADLRSRSVGDLETMIATAVEAACALDWDQLLRRTPTSDLRSVWALERAGFELMDIGVTFSKVLGSDDGSDRVESTIRPATAGDIEAIIPAMVELPWGGRYDADPTYTREQVREVRARWLRNSVAGRADVVLVELLDDVPAGYVTAIITDDASSAEIDLVGTLPTFRGRGVASRLLRSTLGELARSTGLVTVRTQADNFAAAALYERAGFTLSQSDLTFRLNLNRPA
jgi:ribosomal protein S18 acetylase RimI-like enzyme